MDLKALACGMALGTTVMFTVAAATSSKSPDVLRIRNLITADDAGAERVVIAAPVPDPLVLGQRVHRRSAAGGVQINDANGNERGGIVILDDGSFMVGVDDDK